MHPCIDQAMATGALDCVPEGDRPTVLEKSNSGGGPRRNLIRQVPDVVGIEDRAPIVNRLGPRQGAGLGTLLTGRAQSQQRARQGAEGLGLLAGKVAVLDRLELAVLAAGDEHQVDEAHYVVLTEPAKLSEDLAGELSVLETNNQQLYRTEFHLDQLLLLGFELLVVEHT